MAKMTLPDLVKLKLNDEKFTCLTAYDSTMANLVSEQDIDVILVGDSLGNVVQGQGSTVPVTIDDMCYHTRNVANASRNALVVADMPFATYSNSGQALDHAAQLMRAGAEVVKLEGEAWLAPIVTHLKQQGIPVCVHLGLTPQFVNVLGGYKVQGREFDRASQIVRASVELEQAGADMLVIECVPSVLAREVTRSVKIPVMGIGAGVDTDGQVLVIYDMLGLSSGKVPRFVKNFMKLADSPQEAVSHYITEVKARMFPAEEHTFE